MSGYLSPRSSRLWRVAGASIVGLAVTAGVAGISGTATAAPSAGSGAPLPPVTPQVRAIDLAQPATVMVRTDWSAYVVMANGALRHENWRGACTGMIVNSTGSIITAGHCVDDTMEGAQGHAIEMAVDDLVRARTIPQYLRDEYVKQIEAGNIRWRVEGELAESHPDRQVHVELGGGVAKWGETIDDSVDVNARVIEFQPYSRGDVALLMF